ncbi:hypothetical protein KUL49_39600 [Alteromonas sp. KUL49]|nr:hypothetical protein KUL49_39600 [Alteromonas sp. KUL49]
MSAAFISHLQSQITATKNDGLYKKERVITSQQQADIGVSNGDHVINFCANNYLGLANHQDLISAAKAGLDSHGFWRGFRAVHLRYPRHPQSAGISN